MVQPRWSSSVHDFRLLFYASYPALTSHRYVRAAADSSSFLCAGGGTCSGALALLYLRVRESQYFGAYHLELECNCFALHFELVLV